MNELEAMLAFGHVSPRAFSNPVYDPIRGTPRFNALEKRRLMLVNEERAKLALEPVTSLSLGLAQQ
jgi:hypothetical protein